MLTRYGIDVLIGVAIAILLIVGIAIWTDERWLRILLYAIAAFLAIFALNFFRDPGREIAAGSKSFNSIVASPADGKVVLIAELDEPEYMKTKTRMVSIFMSPLDVHVNRIPVNGMVEYLRYVKGEFLVASKPDAVHRNERQVIGIDAHGKKITFSQVTGYIARRIVCDLKAGDSVKIGERFGMIKFGSRVDVYLPLDAVLLIKEGDRVRAGETVLAEWPNQ
jgi:phosphatidylserine decarboxylase